jgi:TatD DNase family protein
VQASGRNDGQVILVDSHCHIDFNEFDVDRNEVLKRTVENKVAYCLVVSVEASSFESLLLLVKSRSYLFASAGIHPNSVSMDSERERQWVSEAGSEGEVVAIGETGLDYFRSEGDLNWQRDRFRMHVQVARELNKPLIIHTRSAAEDTLSVLREETAREAGGVMHCFTEDITVARAALELGFYISLSGIVTFKNATAIQAVAKYVPEDRLLIETDSPYLTPVPHRGKRNEPGYVYHTAVFISELRGVEVAHLADVTTRNFFNLFSGAKRDLHEETLLAARGT